MPLHKRLSSFQPMPPPPSLRATIVMSNYYKRVCYETSTLLRKPASHMSQSQAVCRDRTKGGEALTWCRAFSQKEIGFWSNESWSSYAKKKKKRTPHLFCELIQTP